MLRKLLSCSYDRSNNITYILLLCATMLNITSCDFINKNVYANHKNGAVIKKALPPEFLNDPNVIVNPIVIQNEENVLQKSQSIEERITTLEKNFLSLQQTIDKMSPAITKLLGIENEFDNLTFQLENLINNGDFNNKDSREGELLTNDDVTDLENNSETGVIKKIRLGNHPEKTRIVIETTNNLNYRASVDNSKNKLVLLFTDTEVNMDFDEVLKTSSRFQSIIKELNGRETKLVFQAKKAFSILSQEKIKSSEKHKNFRIIIDLTTK